jgi:hypothetical protein
MPFALKTRFDLYQGAIWPANLAENKESGFELFSSIGALIGAFCQERSEYGPGLERRSLIRNKAKPSPATPEAWLAAASGPQLKFTQRK